MTPSTLLGDVPSAVPVASQHPKVTVYIPKRILQGLDDWKKCYGVESRSEAIVTILEDYLEAVFLEQYEEPPESAAPPRIRLSAVLDEIYELKERVNALEEQLGTAHGEVPSTAPVELAESGETQSNALEEQLSTAHGEVPSTAQRHPEESKSSDVLSEALNTAPVELAESGETQSNALEEQLGTAPGEVLSTAPIKAPLTPLTQSALAKRLGCSVKIVERHRKQGKESFAAWSQREDPDGLAWRWEGRGVRGNPLRFVPATTKAE